MNTEQRFRSLIILAAICLVALAYAGFASPRSDSMPGLFDQPTQTITVSCALFAHNGGPCRGAQHVFWAEAVAILCAATAAWIFVPKARKD